MPRPSLPRATPALHVAPPLVLPSLDFSDDLRYVHILEDATSQSTDLLAAAIRKSLDQNNERTARLEHK